MNVRNCKQCKRLFNYVSGPPICPACREALEETFQKVKAYIEEHKAVGIQQVADECEVDIQQLRQWVKEERLEFAEGSAIGVTCEKCGAVIRTGRYCEKCKAEMVNSLSSAFPSQRPKPEQKKTKESPKMRFLS